MIKKIAERYFLFKCVQGNYNTVDTNKIWDDIYSYVSKNPSYTDYGENLTHISILHDSNNSSYLEVGFLFSDYIKPNNDIITKEIKGGHFDVIKQRGMYRDNGVDKKLFHYRKHLNSVEETLSDFLSSEIYILLD